MTFGQRRVVGYGLLSAITVEIVFRDVVFVNYLAANDWHVESATMQVWLGTTVAQVIGLTAIALWIAAARSEARQ